MGKACPNQACGAYTPDDGAVFCSRCAVPFGHSIAATQVNPPMAAPWQPPPPQTRGGSPWVIVTVALATIAVGGGVFAVVALRSPTNPAVSPPMASTPPSRLEQRAVPTAPVAPAPPPPVVAPPPVRSTSAWLSSVHFHSQVGVDLHPRDLDAADGHCARITGAIVTLEAPGGDQFVSDGTPQRADLEIHLGAPAGGTYDVELGVGHNRFVPVRTGLTGDQSIDLDSLGQHVGRFVRISTQRSGSTVCLDGVLVGGLVPRTAPAAVP